MRRFAVLVSVLTIALLGLAVAGGSAVGSAAQDATPAALAEHPLVGTWIVDTEVDNEADAPSVTVFGADGTVLDASADGATAGTWEATGSSTATVVLVGVFEEEGFGGSYYVRIEIEVDEAGETFEGPYTFTVVAADGTVLETGELMAQGTRLHVPPAEAAGTPLPEIPTWTPATPEAGTPES